MKAPLGCSTFYYLVDKLEMALLVLNLKIIAVIEIITARILIYWPNTLEQGFSTVLTLTVMKSTGPHYTIFYKHKPNTQIIHSLNMHSNI